jgi:hypothetical protein
VIFFFFFFFKIFESEDALRQQRRRVLAATHLFDALLEVTDAGAATDAVRAARDRFATSRDALQTACAPLLKVLDNATLTAQLKRDKVRKKSRCFFWFLFSFFCAELNCVCRIFISRIWRRISVFPSRTWVLCIVLPMPSSLAVTTRTLALSLAIAKSSRRPTPLRRSKRTGANWHATFWYAQVRASAKI